MGKPKCLDPSQLPGLLPGDQWERLQGLRDALPQELQGLPDEKLYHVTVSGSLVSPRSETKYGVSGEVAMGLDVWRHDPKDAPFEFNKDHYFVTRTNGSDGVQYLLHGPYRKGEPDHWRKEIPDEYGDCELLVSRRRSSA
jgi:hypothetical protein